MSLGVRVPEPFVTCDMAERGPAGVAVGSGSDDALSRRLPSSSRGSHTRQTLIQAAETVFVSAGFSEVRVKDITTLAGVSTATFYTYFESKDDLVRALAADLVDHFLKATRGKSSVKDPAMRIEAANLAYLAAYKARAKSMGVVLRLSGLTPGLSTIELDMMTPFRARTAKYIGRLQSQGVVPPEIDAYYAAYALISMTHHVAGDIYENDAEADETLAVAELNALWLRALGIGASNSTTTKGSKT